MDTRENAHNGIDRRTFMRSTAAIGAGLFIASNGCGKEVGAKKPDPLNVGLIGLGEQCQRLALQAIVDGEMDDRENIHFKAICDISPYKRKLFRGRLRAFGHQVTDYENYEKMLAEEKDLNAVIVATPDWVHAPISIKCMEAGLHVYCEKEMSNTLEGAKKMVKASQKTKKLLQIGHQRRSNPRYHAADELIRKKRLLGKVKNVNAQWNRSVASATVPLPSASAHVPAETLKKFGYGSMNELVNWRWYGKFGGGPLGDLGSHQIDIFGWFLGDVNPTSVLAVGGKDYFNFQHDEDVMAIYEYKGNAGVVRAFYQVLNTSGYGTYGTYSEAFMGEFGTILLSECAGDKNKGWACMEDYVEEKPKVMANWQKCVKDGLLEGLYEIPDELKEKRILILGGSRPLHSYPLAKKPEGAVHGPHLKNFFDAIRDSKVKLNCPGEEGYRTAVAVLRANEAIQKGIKVKFKEADFKV